MTIEQSERIIKLLSILTMHVAAISLHQAQQVHGGSKWFDVLVRQVEILNKTVAELSEPK